MKVHFYALTVIAFSLLFAIAPAGDAFGQRPFITVWKTDNPGVTGNQEIRIPATGSFNYSWVNINNPGQTGSGSGTDATTIFFTQPGTYEVHMTPAGSPAFDQIRFFQFSGSDKDKLLEVKSWGSVQWTKFQFNDCPNLKITATDIPDLSNVTDLSFAFSHSGIDTVPSIELWDVSNVTNFTNLFESTNGFNQSLAAWDVSQAIDMGFMFDSAISFNQPLDTWDVSNVINMSYMFRDAFTFDQSMPSWNLNALQGAVGWLIRTGMSCENYSYTLHGWANNPNTASNLTFGAFQVEYSPDVLPARNFLIDSLDWNFQSGDSLGTCNVALGVDFKAFTVRQEQEHGVLSWITASEVNNRGFEVQRSADGRSWQAVGFIASSAEGGNSTRPQHYYFKDARPMAGSNYYRLKQIDLDGVFTYSAVRMLVFAEQSKPYHLYPNPAGDKVTVSGLRPNETFQLFDFQGRALQMPVSVRSEQLDIDLSGLAPGVYRLRIVSASGAVVSRTLLKR